MSVPSPSGDWSDLLASSVVTHTPLPTTATHGLKTVFLDANVSELRIILAQGSHHELAIYSIISKGVLNLEDMDPIGYLPLNKPSLSVHAMKCCAAVSPQWLTQQTPASGAARGADDQGEWVDWEEMKTANCDWAVAAPLACRNPHCERLLGAVLVGGKNTTAATSFSFPSSSPGQFGPSINPEWLKEWSCELAQGIAHASVSVMESSLDMLRLLYPPKVVEALVYNAIAPGGHPDDEDYLAQLLSLAGLGGDDEDKDHEEDVKAATSALADAKNVASAAFSPSPVDLYENNSLSTGPAFSEDAALGSSADLPPQQQEESQSHPATAAITAAAALKSGTGSGIRTVNARNLPSLSPQYLTSSVAAAGAAPGQTRRFSPMQHSPFAAVANPGPFSSAKPPIGAPSSGVRTSGSSERTSGDSYEDRGDGPSRRLSSPSHMAAAVLRQASLQSRPSILHSESAASMSPANSEVEGYEDLLSEDATARNLRRPSYHLDRAHSYESMESGNSDAYNNSTGGGGGGGGSREVSLVQQQGPQYQIYTSTRQYGSSPPSPRVAVVLVHHPSSNEGGNGAPPPQLAIATSPVEGAEKEEEEVEKQEEEQHQGGEYSPRIAVIFPAPYTTSNTFESVNHDSNASRDSVGLCIGGGGGRLGCHYENGGVAATPSNSQYPAHRTFSEHQTAYSQNQQNHPHPQQQHHPQQATHSQSLSTISEGGSQPDVTTMTSRSLSSQLNSFPSNTPPSPLVSGSPASSLHWNQEWDLAFSDARVEQKFTKHVLPQVVVAEMFVGGAVIALAIAFVVMHPILCFNELVRLGAGVYVGGIFPMILLFTLPLFAALSIPEAWTQHRLLLLPGLRLLAAMISAPWLVSLGFSPLQAVPLGVLALTNPVLLRFHIPLQLLCMWVAIQPGIKEFLIAFVIPTAVIYVVERRARRNFRLATLTAAAAAAAAAAAVATGGAVGAASPGSVPAAVVT